MNDSTNFPSSESMPGKTPPIIVKTPRPPKRRWLTGLIAFLLLLSVLFNFGLLSMVASRFIDPSGPNEHFHSGEITSLDKIAIIEINGTIMPPHTERVIKALERAEEDDNVKGIALIVDSPGGLVADSHQIYHKMTQIRDTKPMVVAMKRMAASGGLYVAMGAGPNAKIFAEPTTWTGSIGVIIPRYDVSELAQRWGVTSDPLTTGEFKDSLSPFRKMTDRETEVWKEILDDAFDRFVQVIADNRSALDEAGVRELATGRIFTAEGAKKVGLVDVIGYEEEALKSLQDQLGLESVRCVKYVTPPTLMDIFAGTVKSESDPIQSLIEATVPRAMYIFSSVDALRR